MPSSPLIGESDRIEATERALQKSEARFHQVVEFAPAAMVMIDASGRIRLVNAQAERDFGYPRAELLGQLIEMLIPERFRKGHVGLRTSFFHNPQPRPMTAGQDLYGRRKDGREFPVEIGLSPFETEEGTVVLAALVDVSDRRRREESLRLSEDRFRSIFGAVSEGIFIIDATTGVFVEVNEPGCTMHGYAPGELNGKDIGSVSSGVPPYTHSHALEWIEKAAASKQPQRFGWNARSKDGRLFWAEVSVRIATISGQDVALAVLSDVTERRAVEAQLRQAQKMEAIGQLTGGIAHDFNNLLAVMNGNLELIKEAAAGDAGLDELVGDALRAAARGAALTHKLLTHSRQQPVEPQVVNLEGLVSDLIKLLRRTLKESIAVEISMQPGLWATRIDPNQFEDALLNLAVNARDAMPNGGKLALKCMNALVDGSEPERDAGVPPGSYVLLAVTDTGTGMPKEVLARLFEPFFTTKPMGQGTGLGLAMVHGFAKQSGGSVKVDSAVGRGTTVSLYLPRAESDGADRNDADDAGPVPRGVDGEVVLVLEDDEMVRRFAVRALAGLGYRTIEAADGPEGLRRLNEADRVDLLLADVVLPGGMDGPTVAREARARRPDLGLLFMSAYAKDIVGAHGAPGEITHILTKPFARADLARTVRAILDGRRKAASKQS